MNAFDNLLVDNEFLQLANFQHSTTFNVWQLSTFNFDNFQDSTTLTFDNFQNIQTAFSCGNLVSNMQF